MERSPKYNPVLDDGTTRETVELTTKLRWNQGTGRLQQMVKIQDINKRFQVVNERSEWRDIPTEAG